MLNATVLAEYVETFKMPLIVRDGFLWAGEKPFNPFVNNVDFIVFIGHLGWTVLTDNISGQKITIEATDGSKFYLSGTVSNKMRMLKKILDTAE